MAPWWLRSSHDEEPVAEGADALPEPPGTTVDPPPRAPVAARAATTDNAHREVPVEPSTVTGDDTESGEPSPAPGATEERRTVRRRRGGRRRRGQGKQPRADTVAAAVRDEDRAASPRGEDAEAGAVAAAPAEPAVEAADPAEATVPVSEAARIDASPRAAFFERPARTPRTRERRKIAIFFDLENIARGVSDSEVKKFDLDLVLERLREKGKIIVKKAYADWGRYDAYKRPFHEAAIELIDIPQKHYSGKNSADIKMVVDAMDLCYSKDHLDTFVIVSGDSDFSPLVSKLKENNKYVIGIGVKNSSSNLLIDNCDEFIYYEDMWRDVQRVPRLDHLSPKDAEVFGLMIDAMLVLMREGKDVLWGSMIKQTMKRKRPSFSEGDYGYGAFSELLHDAERKNLIKLRRDGGGGSLVVEGFVPAG